VFVESGLLDRVGAVVASASRRRTMVSEADNNHSADLDDNSLERYHGILVAV
jgi:hypothetical protein